MEEQRLLKKKRKATSENNRSLLLTACTDLAALYVSEGRYQLAIEEYSQLADIYKNENKNIEYAQTTRAIGEAYMGLHQFEEALRYQELYLELAKKEHDKLEEQRALATIGHTYLSWYLDNTSNTEKSHLNKAYKMFMKSLMVCENLKSIGKLEKEDMTARLLCNLGVTQDCLGNFEKSLELLTKSIQICQQYDIYEQLHRGYIAIAALYDKCADYKNAIQNYNFAIEVAKKFKQKPEILCGALLSKSEALLKLGDFHSAKPILYKAYKLNSPNVEERRIIERLLRVVAVMCKTEDQLVVTSDDQSQIKKLYEKMGDCACELNTFDKAVYYYKKMLEAAEKSGASHNELATCYYSLAETYKDNAQYTEAIEFFEKEYSIVKHRLKDNLNTLSKIADTLESANASFEKVKTVYERAFENCRQSKNVKEEKRMITRCIAYMRRNNQHSDAYSLEQYLNQLEQQTKHDSESSSDEQSECHSMNGSVLGEDINLDDLTDISDDSDNDNNTKGEKLVRPRRKKNIVVKNLKGETKLHLAAIKGDVLAVQVLIDQGHPVNIRDHAGWLPLHEAANNGHLEIVRILLENGASINDRGGVGCYGITPLHDAAYNGHVEIMELLLDKGASAVTMTDDGETPLHSFQNWMSNNPVDSRLEEKSNQLIKRLTEAIEKTGQQVKPSLIKNRSSPALKNKENINQLSQKKHMLKRNRSRIEDEEEFSVFSDFSANASSNNGATEYQKVMANLKHKNIKATNSSINSIETNSKRPALISIEDTIDDWLDDDLGNTKTKKRKRSNEKKSPILLSKKPSQQRISIDSDRSNDDNSIPKDFFDGDFSDDEIQIIENNVQERRTSNEYFGGTSIDPNVSKRQQQSSLIDAGFSRCKTPISLKIASNKGLGSNQKQKSKQQFQLTLNNARFNSSEFQVATNSKSSPPKRSTQLERNPSQQNITIADPTLFVDVRIEGRLYRVPILLSQVQTHTIKWLAEQASKRYASKEYMRPTLELETKNGAVLADEDLLSLLFPMGSMEAEQVEARVLKWSLPPLIERYREACIHLNSDPDTLLSRIIEELSVSLNLSNKGLMSKFLSPICKAINHQSNLLELDLSGNFLDTDCFNLLCSSLPSLENLNTLNLSCTGIKTSHLSLLASSLSPQSKITNLNLCDNLLKNESLYHLRTITNNIELTYLNISAIGLKSVVDNVELSLQSVQAFDISDNELNVDDICKLLHTLNSNNLRCLNLSRNAISNNNIIQSLITKNVLKEGMKLDNLELSRCHIEDSEIFGLLGFSSNKFDSVNLSYNSELTGLSLRRLLEYPFINHLNLMGCKNIFKYFEDYIVGSTIFGGNSSSSKSLKIYFEDENQAENIINIFSNFYSDSELIVEQLTNFLSIKVNKKL